MKPCAACGSKIEENKRGRPREYCKDPDCIRRRKARTMRELYYRDKYGEDYAVYMDYAEYSRAQ